MRLPTWFADRERRVLRLIACLAFMSTTWLIVLPAAGRLPAVREHVRRNEARGIDPSAKFYTELPAWRELVESVEVVQRRDPAAFWSVSPRSDFP